MRGIEAQFLSLQKGFHEIIPQHLLRPFDERELEVSYWAQLSGLTCLFLVFYWAQLSGFTCLFLDYGNIVSIT